METLLQLFTTVAFFTASILGQGIVPSLSTHEGAQVQSGSVELGLNEVSPNGEAGGFAIPASGCSAADPRWHGGPADAGCVTVTKPTITVDKPIIRVGDTVKISWDPKGNAGCVLSPNVQALTVTPLNTATAPNANAVGSKNDTPTAETTYSIVCGAAGNEASVSVRVLPRIQET